MEAFVGLTQLTQRRFEECLVLVFLSCAQGCQSVEAHINAYGVSTWVWWIGLRVFQFDGNACKPPIGGFCGPCACFLPPLREALRPFYPSNIWDPGQMIPPPSFVTWLNRRRRDSVY